MNDLTIKQPKTVFNPEREFIAWVAGIIDGEGYIGVNKSIRNKKYIRHSLRVSVKMTHEPTVSLLHKKFGGNFREVKLYGNRKPQYNWEVNTLSACGFLKIVYPYLFTKKEHARLGIEFQEKLVKDTNKLKTLDKGNFNKREEILLKFRKLNKRGARI